MDTIERMTAMMDGKHECRFCGKPYMRKHGSDRFCSELCKRKAHNIYRKMGGIEAAAHTIVNSRR